MLIRKSLGDAFGNLATTFRWLAFLPFLLLVGQQVMYEWNTYADPISNVFRPISISIPDHCRGHDPQIVVHRFIGAPFEGRYHSQIEDVNGGQPVIDDYDSPWFNYKPKNSTEYRPLFFRYFGKPLDIPPGRYVAEFTWTIRRPAHRLVAVTLRSNEFTVRDCK